MEIYIRNLKPEDSHISWAWRNDSEIWNLTGRKWNAAVTQNIEEEWIKKVLAKDDEKRFAICVKTNDLYIGNVQLTDISNTQAYFHIFIGDKKYWGKGIATKATQLILQYAFLNLKLKKVCLKVQKRNLAAIKVYEKVGFEVLEHLEEEIIMKISNFSWNKFLTSTNPSVL